MGTPLQAMPSLRRPRERLIRSGPQVLTDAELVGLLLGAGRVGCSATDLAEELLGAFGGLDALRRARVEDLTVHPGIGPAKASLLAAAFALGRRSRASEARVLRSSADIAVVVAPHLADAPHERVAVVVVDAANRVRRVEVVSEGAVDGATVPIREIVALVLRSGGRGFAVAHNHPSGQLAPSDADVRATQVLRSAATAVGLRFLDHVIVSGDGWCGSK